MGHVRSRTPIVDHCPMSTICVCCPLFGTVRTYGARYMFGLYHYYLHPRIIVRRGTLVVDLLGMACFENYMYCADSRVASQKRIVKTPLATVRYVSAWRTDKRCHATAHPIQIITKHALPGNSTPRINLVNKLTSACQRDGSATVAVGRERGTANCQNDHGSGSAHECRLLATAEPCLVAVVAAAHGHVAVAREQERAEEHVQTQRVVRRRKEGAALNGFTSSSRLEW